ncbi:MAG: alpha/beta hydrolase-fold protein [Pirellulales bacterium]|nr:alpha/beta hydrolase-fold protein [Pirellulales bacterium]
MLHRHPGSLRTLAGLTDSDVDACNTQAHDLRAIEIGDADRQSGDSAREPLHFALFAPLHYERNYAYPLLIWLHGPQDQEQQLRQVMPHISLRNYVAVGPRGTAPDNHPHAPLGVGGFTWDHSPRGVEQAEQRVLRCLELAAQKFHISRRRIFVAGLESGGTMALRLALRQPRLFAGGLSLGGAFPDSAAPLAKLHEARELPLFITTCKESQLYPEHQVCEQLRLFHAAGLNMMLRQYPGEDGLTDLMLADMDRWLMEQINQPRRSVSAAQAWAPTELTS